MGGWIRLEDFYASGLCDVSTVSVHFLSLSLALAAVDIFRKSGLKFDGHCGRRRSAAAQPASQLSKALIIRKHRIRQQRRQELQNAVVEL